MELTAPLRACLAVVLIILIVLLSLVLLALNQQRQNASLDENPFPVSGGSRHRARTANLGSVGAKPLQPQGLAVSRFPPSILRVEGSALDFGLFETKGAVSLYSSLMPWHLPDVDVALRAEFPGPPPRAIIDATAHIGVDSANFLRIFPRAKVTAIEIDPSVARVLRRNAARIAARYAQPGGGIEVVEGDSLAYLRRVAKPVDLIFLDPPWGGPGVHSPLDLSGEPLPKVVAELLRAARVIVVKLPRWTDLDAFDTTVGEREIGRAHV
jgi:hypothetical protein